MLQATDLTVEVAARAVVKDGSFLLRDGDKVGLVGRNGTGKTSLLKVLAGEVQAAGGVVLRRGTLGYVPQDPRPDPKAIDATALTRLLSGRDLDGQALRLEEARLALETDHSEQALHRFSHAEEVFRDAGGYSGESDARKIAAGLGVQPDRVDLPSACSPAASGGGSSSAGRSSPRPACCSSTSRPTTSTRTPRSG